MLAGSLTFKNGCLDGGEPSGEDINMLKLLALKCVRVRVCFDLPCRTNMSQELHIDVSGQKSPQTVKK